MILEKQDRVTIQTSIDVTAARQRVRAWSSELKFSIIDQTKLVTAASELARNTLIYGGGGEMVMELLNDGVRRGLRLTFADEGPGIPDVELALRDGFTSGGGLGMGLGGAKRLVHEFEIDTTVGKGTKIRITRWH